MSKGPSRSAIVEAVAELAARRITRKIIAELQRMTDTLSGDDSELKTVWDEICAQVQHEESFFWDAYDETVRGIVGRHVQELSEHERDALWLQTDAGIDWQGEDGETRESHPVAPDDIVDHLTRRHIYRAAGEWSNARIRAFIERAGMRD